jgi:hypothetical protein
MMIPTAPCPDPILERIRALEDREWRTHRRAHIVARLRGALFVVALIILGWLLFTAVDIR